MRPRDLAAAGVVVAAAAITVIVVRRQPDWSLAGPGWTRLAVEVMGAVALAAAGLAMRVRERERHSGGLFVGAAVAWLAAEWNSPGATGAVVFTAGLLLTGAAAPLVAHALLAHARGRLTEQAERAIVVAAYAGLLALGGAGAALATDPGAQGCAVCPGNLVRVADAPAAASTLQTWGLRLGTIALVLAVVLLARSLVQATTTRRRVDAPIIVAGLACLAIELAGDAHAWSAGWAQNDSFARALRLAEAFAFAGIAVAVAWQRVAAVHMRHRLARIVVALGQAPRPGALGDLLAAALGDPSLELRHAIEGGWIDAAGVSRPLPDAPGRTVTYLVQEGEVVAAALHRPGLLDDPLLVEELSAAAGVALEHDRLQARLRGELERLRLARATAVAAADRERYQLERDLHDGAQQGLVALAIAVELERAAAPAPGARALGRARALVRDALDEVRVIAHGLYLPALADAGLAAALDVLAEWSPNLETRAVTHERVDAAAESTAYFVVAACARDHSRGDRFGDVSRGRLVVDVETGGAPDLAELADRVGALGGRLDVTAT